MAGKSSINGNWAPGSPATRYKASGKNRDFYTFENAPGIGAYATGGTIIDGGDGYIYHIFTGSGTFTVNRPSAAIDIVDYLIVAGGGGSQPGGTAGGGGGGGLLFGNVLVSQSSYPISIGAGGNTTPTPSPSTCNGTPSTAFGITAAGGGGGGRPTSSTVTRAGAPGGSGGGGAPGPTSPSPGPGGTSSPTTIPRQGYRGANAGPIPGSGGAGGGGAGGGGSAGTSSPTTGGAAGPGRIVPEFPSTIVRQAIPAPVRPSWEPLVGPGGYAAGGSGSPIPSTRSTPANSGYGGEPASLAGRVGGSGIVCIRYKKTAAYSRATGGTIEPNTHPEHPGVWRHIFTSPGTFEITDPTLQWIDYLAVGGGGGGGNGPTPAPPFAIGGGGGAGGFVSSIHTSTTTPLVIPEAYPWNPGYSVQVGEQMPVAVGTYPIGIGTGGNAATVGNDTTIGSPGPTQIIAYGGGRGGTAPQAGGDGGSGGGGAKIYPGTFPGAFGSASPSPRIQGNSGASTPTTPNSAQGAGGGGAGQPGGATGGGGAGWYSVLSPSAYGTPGPLTPTAQYRYFAGGGGGYNPPTGAGVGGAGGGGAGNGSPGTINTGGGGGGRSGPGFGGVGGPGIVIIQYPE
jgi:hypothetical protein